MILANAAATLARWGHRVLCIDGDIEAPGLHYYLPTEPTPAQTGFLELIRSFSTDEPLSWKEAIIPVTLDTGGEIKLDLMRAGSFDFAYKERLHALDLGDLYTRHGLGQKLEELCRDWRDHYDHILIDSRTGMTDIGGVLSIQLPDQLILLCTLNRQGLSGLREVAIEINRVRSKLPLDRARLPILPLITAYAGRFEVDLGDKWSEQFEQSLGFLYEDWLDYDEGYSKFIYNTRVPYVPKWSFGEQLPVLHEDPEDVDNISFSLTNIAALIAHRLSDSEIFLDNRTRYLRDSTRNAMVDKTLRSLREEIEQARLREDNLGVAQAFCVAAEYKKGIGEMESAADDYYEASTVFNEIGQQELAEQCRVEINAILLNRDTVKTKVHHESFAEPYDSYYSLSPLSSGGKSEK